jgi:hypothetical protein
LKIKKICTYSLKATGKKQKKNLELGFDKKMLYLQPQIFYGVVAQLVRAHDS